MRLWKSEITDVDYLNITDHVLLMEVNLSYLWNIQ